MALRMRGCPIGYWVCHRARSDLGAPRDCHVTLLMQGTNQLGQCQHHKELAPWGSIPHDLSSERLGSWPLVARQAEAKGHAHARVRQQCMLHQ